MRCPNCGEEIKEGSLYCYECGEDIHIVPDYDPNLDLTFSDSDEEEEYGEEDDDEEMSLAEKIKGGIQIVFLIAAIFVVVSATLKVLDFEGNDHRNPSAIQIGHQENTSNVALAPVIPVPRFSYNEGYYNEVIPLKINADEGYKVYYTLDGSNPTERGLLFRDTIVLDDGTYEIKAVCQAENGRYSEIVSKVYQVEIILPEAPVVITLEGDYSRPTMIEVEIPWAEQEPVEGGEPITTPTPEEGEEEEIPRRIVYTTDGTAPNAFSKEYTEPIPMPLGESEFTFAYIDDLGVVSELTVRKYRLNIFNSISLVTAKENLYSTLAGYGKRVEKYFTDEGYGVYRYVYTNVTTIDNMDFYIFDEILVRVNDVTGPTDRHYGIHVTTGTIYYLENNGFGGYRLVDLKEIYGEQ